jgi:hypothetical protein
VYTLERTEGFHGCKLVNVLRLNIKLHFLDLLAVLVLVLVLVVRRGVSVRYLATSLLAFPRIGSFLLSCR